MIGMQKSRRFPELWFSQPPNLWAFGRFRALPQTYLTAHVRIRKCTGCDTFSLFGVPRFTPISLPARCFECHPMRLLLLPAVLLTSGIAGAGSSNSLLDISPDGARLLVANSDNGIVTVIYVKERKAVREIPVGDHPEGVAWVGDSPVAVVSIYRDDRLVFVDTTTGKVESLSCAAEPYGVVVTRDGRRAFVSHDY